MGEGQLATRCRLDRQQSIPELLNPIPKCRHTAAILARIFFMVATTTAPFTIEMDPRGARYYSWKPHSPKCRHAACRHPCP